MRPATASLPASNRTTTLSPESGVIPVIEIEIVDELELLNLAEARELRCLQGAAKPAGKEPDLPDAMASERTADETGLGAAFFIEIALDRAIPEIDAGRLFKDAGRLSVAHEDDVAWLLQQRPDRFASPGGRRCKPCPGKQD